MVFHREDMALLLLMVLLLQEVMVAPLVGMVLPLQVGMGNLQQFKDRLLLLSLHLSLR